MINKQQVYIVIPAYNEESIINSVIKKLRRNGYHNIVVIDDGSQDNTAQIATHAGAKVLRHFINRGQGAALQTGLEYIRENFQPEVIITFDADGQHRPQDISRLIQPIIKNQADIVLGTRFLNKKHAQSVPFWRRVMLKTAVWFTTLISGVRLTDTHNGLRALGPTAYQQLKITRRGMEHASEIIDHIKKHGWRYQEVPVKINYTDYSQAKGQPTSNFIKLGLKILLHKLMN